MIRIAFFGTDEFSLGVCEIVIQKGFTPELIITSPSDKTVRGKTVEPVMRTFAEQNNIPHIQPETLTHTPTELTSAQWDLFIVASYGKIIPRNILDIPTHGTLNVHPSLLPQYRGASPIESAILDRAKETGVTIMVVDEKMDHGPIIAQESIPLDSDIYYPDLAVELARRGGLLLAAHIPQWIQGSLISHEQDDTQASYTKKINAIDGRIDPNGDAEENYAKVRAFLPWPKAYYFHKKNDGEIRVAITRAHINEHGLFTIDMVIPAGKKEMPYTDFLRGIR